MKLTIAAWRMLPTRWFFMAAVLLGLGGTGSALATTVRPPTFEGLVNNSDYVVHAVVRAVSAEKRTSAHGTKIVTRVELDVIEAVTGKPPATVALEMLGGRVGDEQMTVDGSPRFSVGDEDILFVRDNGRSICPLVAMMHGRYLVEREPTTGRKFVSRVDGLPLRDAAQVSLPMAEKPLTATIRRAAAAALTPADFIQRVKAVKAAASNREK